jgi:hypothetical protein
VNLWNCELFCGFKDGEQQRMQKPLTKRRGLRREDKSDTEAFGFALKFLNLTPRGAFENRES